MIGQIETDYVRRTWKVQAKCYKMSELSMSQVISLLLENILMKAFGWLCRDDEFFRSELWALRGPTGWTTAPGED